MPPNSHQTGQFPFANNCITVQTFKVTAHPQADWLRFEPSTVEVGPETSFSVQVTVSTAGNRTPGRYRSGLMVVCATCAATEPPCLQDAGDFPISLTIADIKTPGGFEPTAAPAPAVPQPIVTPPDPPRLTLERFVPLIGGVLLAAGSVGMLVAVRGLYAGRAPLGML
jgi:hypothetical protein